MSSGDLLTHLYLLLLRFLLYLHVKEPCLLTVPGAKISGMATVKDTMSGIHTDRQHFANITLSVLHATKLSTSRLTLLGFASDSASIRIYWLRTARQLPCPCLHQSVFFISGFSGFTAWGPCEVTTLPFHSDPMFLCPHMSFSLGLLLVLLKASSCGQFWSVLIALNTIRNTAGQGDWSQRDLCHCKKLVTDIL